MFSCEFYEISKNTFSKNTFWWLLLNECLTIVCCGINQKGPVKFRTRAYNPKEQLSYVNISPNDKLLDTSLDKRVLNNDFENNDLQKQSFGGVL